jgi:cell pole-organizing protein PopZ
MRQSGEPSVEEILQSIKQVMARDHRAAQAGRDRGTAEDAMGPAAGDEQGRKDVLELPETAELDAATAGEDDGPLIRPEARESMRDSLAALAMLSEPGAPPQIVRSGETSLEGLARELLRPALAEWLEKNLPPLVERMVAAEISRIVGKKI